MIPCCTHGLWNLCLFVRFSCWQLGGELSGALGALRLQFSFISVCHVRSARKAEKGRDALRQQLGLPEAVKLLPESDRDAQEAAVVAFGSSSGYANNK